MGNTVEENTALRGIATRLVDQQLATEPAPGRSTSRCRNAVGC